MFFLKVLGKDNEELSTSELGLNMEHDNPPPAGCPPPNISGHMENHCLLGLIFCGNAELRENFALDQSETIQNQLGIFLRHLHSYKET